MTGEPPDDVQDFVAERLEGLLRVPVEFVARARASGLAQLGQIAARDGAGGAPRAGGSTPYIRCTRADRLAGEARG